MPWYGNKRHPATDSVAPEPKGPATGSNAAVQGIVTNGPSLQSIAHARGLGLAINTASPMSSGTRVWAGDPGTGVHRFGGLRPAPHGDPAGGAISPVQDPTAVRYGMQSGPSQAPAYPSTGLIAGYGSLAAMDMGKLSSLGYGG